MSPEDARFVKILWRNQKTIFPGIPTVKKVVEGLAASAVIIMAALAEPIPERSWTGEVTSPTGI